MHTSSQPQFQAGSRHHSTTMPTQPTTTPRTSGYGPVGQAINRMHQHSQPQPVPPPPPPHRVFPHHHLAPSPTRPRSLPSSPPFIPPRLHRHPPKPHPHPPHHYAPSFKCCPLPTSRRPQHTGTLAAFLAWIFHDLSSMLPSRVRD